MTKKSFPGELDELRARLREAEETLDAIRSGAVDAIVVSGKTGEQVYTLLGADQSYRLLVESINDGIITLSMDGTILYSNRQFAGMLGYSLEKIIGSSFSNLIAKDYRHHLENALREASPERARFDALLNSCEGGKIPARITLGSADLSGAGPLTAVIADLSEQHRYREIVREEKLSQSIMENSPDGIAVCDPNGLVIRASSALNLLGKGSALQKPFDQVFSIKIPVKNRAPEAFSVSRVLAGKSLLNTEASLHCPDKEVCDVSISAVPLRNEDRVVVGCLITITDITERKLAERQFFETDQRLQALMRALPVGVSVSDDATCRSITGNPAVLQQFELRSADNLSAFAPEEKAPGRQVRFFRDGQQISGSELPLQRAVAENREIPPMELDVELPSGRRWTTMSTGAPIYDNDGNIIGGVAVTVDITERKQMELELQERAAQLADANRELENFSYSVSHDLKAPLRAIDGYSRMLMKKYGNQIGEDAARMLDVIRTSTERMGRLIDDLLSFSRVLRNSLAITEIDMNKLVSQVWDDTQAARQNREIEVRIAQLLPGFGDAALIRQVLFNLISNAVKFTRDRMPGVIEMNCYKETGENVYLVKDNGVGFDMNYYGKLFNVFQRLHSPDEFEGTGAGLAIVSRIIKRHGGRVWAEGAVDKGACFYFSLPARGR